MLSQFFDIVLHLDVHLASWSQVLGPWLYLVLFLIVFCETGLVVTPFLPGDSLLFAVGALCALESGLKLPFALLVLIAAAVLGDSVNYGIGRYFGERLMRWRNGKLVNPAHIAKTNAFYESHGGKTVVFARFFPILRTYAPFVAGIARMKYRRFTQFNIFGGASWVLSFLLLGYWFGNLPQVKKNFHWVIIGIVVLSLIPAGIRLIRQRRPALP